ncbi:hypothetical protein ABWJ92_36545 [Streptomyces sp. NPDC000609]|uniref:hypothetical protein n=1 Tax=Streptomyces sp. NPDC000609 TaxID=3160957 RepID=UPI00339B62B2
MRSVAVRASGRPDGPGPLPQRPLRVYQYPFDPDHPHGDADFTDRKHLEDLVRAAAGIPDLDVTVRDTMV